MSVNYWKKVPEPPRQEALCLIERGKMVRRWWFHCLLLSTIAWWKRFRLMHRLRTNVLEDHVKDLFIIHVEHISNEKRQPSYNSKQEMVSLLAPIHTLNERHCV